MTLDQGPVPAALLLHADVVGGGLPLRNIELGFEILVSLLLCKDGIPTSFHQLDLVQSVTVRPHGLGVVALGHADVHMRDMGGVGFLLGVPPEGRLFLTTSPFLHHDIFSGVVVLLVGFLDGLLGIDEDLDGVVSCRVGCPDDGDVLLFAGTQEPDGPVPDGGHVTLAMGMVPEEDQDVGGISIPFIVDGCMDGNVIPGFRFVVTEMDIGGFQCQVRFVLPANRDRHHCECGSDHEHGKHDAHEQI